MHAYGWLWMVATVLVAKTMVDTNGAVGTAGDIGFIATALAWVTQPPAISQQCGCKRPPQAIWEAAQMGRGDRFSRLQHRSSRHGVAGIARSTAAGLAPAAGDPEAGGSVSPVVRPETQYPASADTLLDSQSGWLESSWLPRVTVEATWQRQLRGVGTTGHGGEFSLWLRLSWPLGADADVTAPVLRSSR